MVVLIIICNGLHIIKCTISVSMSTSMVLRLNQPPTILQYEKEIVLYKIDVDKLQSKIQPIILSM